MHDAHEAGVGVLVERLEQGVVAHVLAPIGVDLDHVGAEAHGDLDDAPPEEAVDPDDGRVPGLEQVGEPALHPRGPGGLEREHQPAFGLVGDPLERHDLEQDVGEVRVHVAQERLLQGGQRGR